MTLHHDHHGLQAMRDAIAAARDEILLEMYWFGSDHTGWLFAEALCAAARAGRLVCLVYDAVGSIGSDEAVFDAMRAAGCKVVQYHPIAPWRARFRLGRIGHRNHRKLLVVDGRIAMIGGINIGDPWAERGAGGGGWRDDLVAIEGPAAAAVRGIFQRSWDVLGTDPGEGGDDDDQGSAFEVGDARVRVLGNHYRDERKVIRAAYLTRIHRATSTLYIANPYFVPDRTIRRALRAAVRRGVDVRVLVPGESDVPAVAWASRAFYDELLRAGVRIFEWRGAADGPGAPTASTGATGAVLHAKTACGDDDWLTIGTYNLDARSGRYNLEINAMIEDHTLARGARKRFLLDLEHAQELTLPVWRDRPMLQRLLEAFFAFFAGWL